MLQRKNFFNADYNCVMCGMHMLETIDHLFLHYPFVQMCCSYLCHTWEPIYQGIQYEIDNLKELLDVPFPLELIVLASWAIWTTRNYYIFKGLVPNFYILQEKFEGGTQIDSTQSTKKSLSKF